MTSMSGSALATVQARRFSARTQRHMRKRGGAAGGGINAVSTGVSAGGRSSLYHQMYTYGGRNGVS